ncbi:EAL domain-containing protein [Shewanella litoralis]|uniref:Diguanylate cyclase n=1 Tax=Shewanella litoralis TaxID=2282700 RepID=A0ABQ2RAZ3_9GAMM|nr:EAL domain-containing protein [Shewanella litoralis]GGQ21946.1 diguanylate cyclase [Shewanella litoralis]
MVNLNIFFSFFENAALLLALVYLYSLFPSHQRQSHLFAWQFSMGVLIGIFGVIIMMNPFAFQEGLLFDTRSVLLCLSGLFFGFIPTIIASACMALYRYNLGGSGALVGILMLFCSGFMGAIWRHYRKDHLDQISKRAFYLFGVVVHLVLLSSLLLLPLNQAIDSLLQVSLPILIIFPLLTMVIGHLLAKIVFRERDMQVKLQEDFLFKNQFDIGNIGISITSKAKYWLKVNPYLCQMFGYTESELKARTWVELTYPDDLNKDLLLYDKMVKGDIDEYEMDKRFVAKDGSIIYTHITITCRRNVENNGFLVIAGFLDITKQKKAEQALLQSKEQLDLVLDSSELGVWDWDVDSQAMKINRYSADILCCSVAELNQTPKIWVDAIHPQDKFRFLRSIIDVRRGRCTSQRIEYQLINLMGETRWILQTGKVVDIDDRGRPLRVCGTLSDITDIKQVEESLNVAASVYQNSSEAMSVFTSDGTIVDSNPAFSLITGFHRDEIQGQNLRVFQSELQPKRFYDQLDKQLNQLGRWQGEVWMRRKNGENYLILLTINSISQTKTQSARYVALFSDITEKKQTEELIWRQANYDALTGLPNRRMLLEFLTKEVLHSDRQHNHFALMFLDLDYFKEINDTLGHDMGDILLLETAERLKSSVRETDVVARLGGDEFTIVLTNLDDNHGVERVASQILKRLAEPYILGQQTAYISGSIGITLFPDDATTTEALLKNADQAMYSAKTHGRNRFNYFTPAMQNDAQKRMLLVQELKNAILQQQFELYYQPIVELGSEDIVKVEALIRWNHPTMGFVSPADFIPIAEETGMIIEIGNWVFSQAVAQSAKWKQRFNVDIQISINKSPIQFRDDTTDVSDWLSQMAEQHVDAKNICIEITEGLLLEKEQNVEAKLLAYREAGLEVSLDDFGTGYSSLSYLRKFNIDYLKIDKSFVNNLTPDSNDLSLCEAIIVMAHKLGMKVIAEGIETEQQRNLLEFAGCDYGQGYLFSHALCSEEFENKYMQQYVAPMRLNELVSG